MILIITTSHRARAQQSKQLETTISSWRSVNRVDNEACADKEGRQIKESD